MRREGKIGRRKVFPKVKNVNVESLKKRSKLLDFLGATSRSDETAGRREEETKRGRVKETKSQRDKETKGERRNDRLFETLMFMNLIH